MLHVDFGSSKDESISAPHQLQATKKQPLVFNCTANPRKESDRHHCDAKNSEQSSNEFLSRHMMCFQNGKTHVSGLQLLLVNRQVYHETRCVPYALNTFVFLSRSSLMHFATQLLRPHQAEALRNITVWVPLNDIPRPSTSGALNWHFNVGLEPLALQRLSGLLNLEVKISMFHSYLQWITSGVADDWKDGSAVAGLQDLKALSLRTVKVSVEEEHSTGCHCCTQPGQVLQQADVTSYAEGVRRQILGRT